MKSKTRVLSIAVLAAGALILWHSVSTRLASAQDVPSGDESTISDLVLANRILASSELGILGTYGHVSARSKTNPNHYFISRYVSAGAVIASDIIENDLDSVSVKDSRKDEYQERFIHGEIYKARPDVMAVLHAHTPELVVFGVSSVPLIIDGSAVPNFDIRKLNKGMPGIITTPTLGKALAASLGKSPAVLMFGHGVAVTGGSVAGLVIRANRMRREAQAQIMATALGGKLTSYEPQREASGDGATHGVPGSADDGERAWESWKAMITRRMAAETKLPPLKQHVPTDDLVTANKIFASSELGRFDELGHVSMRNPSNPNHFYITRDVSPALATSSDVIENDLDCNPTSGPRGDQYREVYMHCAIYKARPDVMSVVYGHTPELDAFGQSSVQLRPMMGDLFSLIGDGLPKFDVRSTGAPNTAIDTPEKGKLLAQALGNKPAVFLPNHGEVIVDVSLYTMVKRVDDLKVDAWEHAQAILLRGKFTDVKPLPGTAANTQAPGESVATPAVPTGNGGGTAWDRPWEYWRQVVSRQN